MPDAGMHVQVARRCNIKLYCSERKRGVMECLDMPGEPAYGSQQLTGIFVDCHVACYHDLVDCPADTGSQHPTAHRRGLFIIELTVYS